MNVSEEVGSLYKLAAVEYAILGTRRWANLLDISNLDILEFASDLKVCVDFFSHLSSSNADDDIW